jgi:hypothetical protein
MLMSSEPKRNVAVAPVNAGHFGVTPWSYHALSPMHAVRWVGKLLLRVYWDLPTRIAEILWSVGMHRAAEELLWRAYCAYPYDHALGEYLANWLYDHHQNRFALGTIERGNFLMQVLERSYPSPRLTTAYFENLAMVLEQYPERTHAGRVVLGLGAGRCGSTTLAGILHTIDGAVSTHECPPFLHWDPLPTEQQFHLRRLELYSRHVPLVADCAHWWINSLEEVFSTFPDAMAIGLIRDTNACVRSWMTVSSSDCNHFVPAHNRIWSPDRWDPLYPHYELPDDAQRDPTHAKEALVRYYIEQYNRRLKALQARLPDRILLLATEELDSPGTRARISEFLQLPVGTARIHHNAGRDWDCASADGLYF